MDNNIKWQLRLYNMILFVNLGCLLYMSRYKLGCSVQRVRLTVMTMHYYNQSASNLNKTLNITIHKNHSSIACSSFEIVRAK